VYTIGDVSKIVNVSTNTLRYYDEIELLKPCEVQANNQYRYYSDSQIQELVFILEMKQYGFSLNQIKILLKNKSDDKLKALLEEKRIELCNEIAMLNERYLLLEKRIAKIAEGESEKMKENKVLIVDDFALARKLIRNIIEDYGYNVVGEAANGEEAIIAYEELKPDFVIMDITMPKLDGIDATNKITNKYKDARIIICSATNEASVLFESLKAGAKDFILKPISSHRLIQALERILDNNHVISIEKINNITAFIDNNWRNVGFSRMLQQEEIDLLLFQTENSYEDTINNIFNKAELSNATKHEYSNNGPFEVELKIINYIKDKAFEMSQELSYYLSEKLNAKYTIKLQMVENITKSEFKSLIMRNSDIGIIKYNTSSLPIHISIFCDLENKQVFLREFLGCVEKNLKSILSKLVSNYTISTFDVNDTYENYSTISISFDMELNNEVKGFAMLSFPHDLLKYMH
jgi:Response regulator containing a CheY-like receiver domain and an HTH DNA-binding domain